MELVILLQMLNSFSITLVLLFYEKSKIDFAIDIDLTLSLINSKKNWLKDADIEKNRQKKLMCR